MWWWGPIAVDWVRLVSFVRSVAGVRPSQLARCLVLDVCMSYCPIGCFHGQKKGFGDCLWWMAGLRVLIAICRSVAVLVAVAVTVHLEIRASEVVTLAAEATSASALAIAVVVGRSRSRSFWLHF